MQHAQQVQQLDATGLGVGLSVDQPARRPAALGTTLRHQLNPLWALPLQHESCLQLGCVRQDNHAELDV